MSGRYWDIYKVKAESETTSPRWKMIDTIVSELIREEEEILSMRIVEPNLALSGRKGGSRSDIDQLIFRYKLESDILTAKLPIRRKRRNHSDK